MICISLSTDAECAAFAKLAAEAFAADRKLYTYADVDPKPGGLFAVRWNSFAVLVVRLDDNFDPRVYPSHDLIQKDIGCVETGGTP